MITREECQAGGRSRSAAKIAAARENGYNGGRPKIDQWIVACSEITITARDRRDARLVARAFGRTYMEPIKIYAIDRNGKHLIETL